jgi:uncharacterized protein YbcI
LRTSLGGGVRRDNGVTCFVMEATTPATATEGNLSRDLARSMVNLFKEYVGRGPTHARAHVCDDLVVIVLRDTMIKAEKTLAEEGEEDLVRGVRRVFQGKFRDDATGIVERLTGRKVIAFLSDHDVDEDVAIEAFVLESQGDESAV